MHGSNAGKNFPLRDIKGIKNKQNGIHKFRLDPNNHRVRTEYCGLNIDLLGMKCIAAAGLYSKHRQYIDELQLKLVAVHLM